MKFIFVLSCLVIINVSLLGNEKPVQTRITQTRDFAFRVKSTTQSKQNGTDFSREQVKLIAEYDSKNGGTLVLKFADNQTDSIILNYPLDFYFYTLSMDAKFTNRKQGYLIEHSSHLEVFTWLTSIVEKPDNTPIAGSLHLMNYVKVHDRFSMKNLNIDYERNTASLMQHVDSMRIMDIKIDTIQKLIKEADKLKQKDSASKNQFIKKINVQIGPDQDGIIKVIRDSLDKKLKKEEEEKSKYLGKINRSKIYKIEDIQIQFEGGFIERIQVTVFRENRHEIFENLFPIGFSSIPNYADFSNVKLFSRGNKNGENEFILLSDVINRYENELDIKTKDYSPADTVLRIDPTKMPLIKLSKQHLRYIIDGKAFTDANGFSEDSPNGLVQIELSRRFLLNTKRNQFIGQNNYGFFTYLHAQVNYSKIEDKLKGLVLSNKMEIENNTIVSPYYATNLDFLRYENLSLTTDLNVLIWDSPHYKLSYFLDLGIRYGHTPISDSVSGDFLTPNFDESNFSAHSFTIYPRLKIQIFAERRYGLEMYYQLNYRRILSNNNFKQVVSYSGKGNDLNTLFINPSARYFHTVEAQAFFDANPKSRTGKLFAVARFHFQHRDINTFFPQILLGYAFNFYN